MVGEGAGCSGRKWEGYVHDRDIDMIEYQCLKVDRWPVVIPASTDIGVSCAARPQRRPCRPPPRAHHLRPLHEPTGGCPRGLASGPAAVGAVRLRRRRLLAGALPRNARRSGGDGGSAPSHPIGAPVWGIGWCGGPIRSGWFGCTQCRSRAWSLAPQGPWRPPPPRCDNNR